MIIMITGAHGFSGACAAPWAADRGGQGRDMI